MIAGVAYFISFLSPVNWPCVVFHILWQVAEGRLDHVPRRHPSFRYWKGPLVVFVYWNRDIFYEMIVTENKIFTLSLRKNIFSPPVLDSVITKTNRDISA
jgi:hypothetical protein